MRTQKAKKAMKLFKIAEGQHGYFTAKQATAAGYLPTNFTYHVKTGAWVHEDKGLYRLRNFPQSRKAQMMHYLLWSRNREDKIQGVYSHETALSIYELSDVNPVRLHMTVPMNFRKSAETPKVLRLYFQDLKEAEIKGEDGIRVTTPMRTLIDVLQSGKTSWEFVEQAVVQASSRGLISLRDLKSPDVPLEAREQFQKWIEYHRQRERA